MSAVRTIVFTPRAAKEYDSLPHPAQVAIEDGLERYAIEGRGDFKRLQGLGGYRLRMGEYRVIFDEDRTTILAFTIGRRQTTIYR